MVWYEMSRHNEYIYELGKPYLFPLRIDDQCFSFTDRRTEQTNWIKYPDAFAKAGKNKVNLNIP